MNRSRYVVEAIGNDGEHLLYNTENGAFVQLDDSSYDAWQKDICSETLSDALTSYGFLTELTPDEQLCRQQKLFDAERVDASWFKLCIIPTYACNYRCPYCYELGHNKTKGKMDMRVMDAIESFVEFKHEQDDFSSMFIQWYGGDPSLALDEVAELSRRLIAWSDAHGVMYTSMMLTNANVIGETEAHLLADCRISSVYLTIDGPEELHNKRRIAADGSNAYENTINAARFLRANGISLVATMNADKINILEYGELRKKLFEEEGIVLSLAKLCDYGHFYGKEPFSAPDFDLFTHEEFFAAQFAEFAKQDHTANELREKLRPIRRFCNGQLDNYFNVDLVGDVYKCDGRVGEKPWVLFNLFDDPSAWKLHEITFDATRNEQCAECELLPACQGSCIWERVCSDMPCHPFRTTIDDYLRLYQKLLGNEAGISCGSHETASGFAVLAEPYQTDVLGWDKLQEYA
ncbi:MAG: radical SAM protein [Eggerthellaceae bacterium]|nr:radical SAM protein [Eggerthellaceae bacterium]